MVRSADDSNIFSVKSQKTSLLLILLDRNEKRDLYGIGPAENGAHGRSRTSDRLVRSQVLYPAELHARIRFSCFQSLSLERSGIIHTTCMIVK